MNTNHYTQEMPKGNINDTLPELETTRPVLNSYLSASKKTPGQYIMEGVTLIFSQFAEPKAFGDGQKLKYSARVYFKKGSDLDVSIGELIGVTAKGKFPPEICAGYVYGRGAKFGYYVMDGDDQRDKEGRPVCEPREYLFGQRHMKASSIYPPILYDIDGTLITECHDGMFCRESVCRLFVSPFAFTANGAHGVTFRLIGVQKITEGIPSGKQSISQDDIIMSKPDTQVLPDHEIKTDGVYRASDPRTWHE